MKRLFAMLLIGSSILLSCALPVTKTKKDEKEEKPISNSESTEITLEYERYLKEVAEALESDAEFRKKLQNASEADIRSGKIAQELDYVSHHVRSKLDEIKRRELDRLISLANKEFELENEIDRDHLKVNQHLDHNNQHTFEIEDLKKLIKKTAKDLAEVDRKRKDEFKEYEMQKEFEKHMIEKELNEEQRKKYEEEQKQLKEKHKQHEKVHDPGNKAQLEEVWEKQDHMDKQDFDPRIFFMLHDVDGNGYWDEREVKALFIKELDKVYQSGVPEDDMRERAEEMERMREHYFQRADTNKDDLISFQEFIDQTKRDDFNRDAEWHTIDEQPQQYTHEEYLEFERRRKEDIDRMKAQGSLPPHPNMPQGYYVDDPNGPYQTGQHQQTGYQQQPQMHYQNPQQQHMQQQQQYHQQQQQYNQQQQYHNQQQQQQQYPQQVNLNPNQVYQQIPAQQQQPQQQYHYQQQPQPVVNSLPPQQQQQPILNNPVTEKPVASNNAINNPNQGYQQIPSQQQQAQQQYHYQQPQQPQQQYNQQPQQPQPIENYLPAQPIVNNPAPAPVASNNFASQQQPIANNIPSQPINNAVPHQPVQNVQQQQNIPQNH